jgi:hypothetical protein
MTDSCRQLAVYSLLLSNGVEWRIAAGDSESEPILERLAEAMTLKRVSDQPLNSSVRTLSVKVSDIPSMRMSPLENGFLCTLPRTSQTLEDADFVNFVNISTVIAAPAHKTGAILMHAALAKYDRRGVILSAPGGTGKSTASRRFPRWWKSLCDDTTLIICDESGYWRAHPWPTWSAFLESGGRGRWDVAYSVPLEAIFFLNRSETESVEPIGKGEGLIKLLKASTEVSFFSAKLAGYPKLKRKINTQWFSNLTDLAAKVPMYMLNLSLNGEFWKHIERVIDDKQHVSHSPGAQWKP